MAGKYISNNDRNLAASSTGPRDFFLAKYAGEKQQQQTTLQQFLPHNAIFIRICGTPCRISN